MLMGDIVVTRFFVSTDGSDKWSGCLEAPNAEGTDGPFATLGRARAAVRNLKLAGDLAGPVTVLLRGGRYEITDPVVFTPEDSGPVTYAAYPGELPTLDGGKRIEGWRVERRGGMTAWVADLPEVAAGQWYFRQLFVNGQRRSRTRMPARGSYSIEEVPDTPPKSKSGGGARAFRCAPGDIQPWANLTDIEVLIFHLWVEERMPVASFDAQTRLLTSSRYSIFPLKDEKYHLENVKEALSEPGQWYLDRPTGELCYIPMPGEDPETAEVYAPRTEQLLKLAGNPDEGEHVEFLRFIGLGFEHSEGCQPAGGGERWGRAGFDYANAPQAACHIPGAISLKGARYCAIEDCTIQHIGWYGIELTSGCQGIRIVGNTIADLGAGGVKIEGEGIPNRLCPPKRRTFNNHVTDNHIVAGGRIFPSACGILCLDSFGNEISHNHIHDLFYTGISCGWAWGYREQDARNNRMEKNHIHDLGHGVLSDMGGIYTLGIQPGTVIRGNLIHDVLAAVYGGWGVYTDEGSSHIIIENNISYKCNHQPFNQHYGCENIIRNNIFALGKEGQIALPRAEDHTSFTFERNIVVSDGGAPLFFGEYGRTGKSAILVSDLNLFWDISGSLLANASGSHGTPDQSPSLENWQKLGHDRHSVVADPRFRNLEGGDFSLCADSPALELGFNPIDMSDVGPRRRRETDE